MTIAGYQLDVKWEFWREGGSIRRNMDNSLNDYQKNARIHEQSAEHIASRVNALWIDRLCDPWFEVEA